MNGERTSLGTILNPQTDRLTIDSQPVAIDPAPRVYWLFNKPKRTLTTHRDDRGRRTIFDLPSLSKLSFRVLTAGRLDYMTEGLLILSNDGEFIHRLTHPRFHQPREYVALVSGRLTKEQEAQIRTGIQLEDGPVRPSQITFSNSERREAATLSWYYLTVHEGRNRLVRRMFEAMGHEVVRLIRIGYGPVRLPDDLAPGSYRALDPRVVKSLRHHQRRTT